jgi:hypothetical protein
MWMNEPLYKFAIRQAVAEDYAIQDLKQCYRQLSAVSQQRDEALALGQNGIRIQANANELIAGIQSIADNAVIELEQCEKAMTRWKRYGIISGPVYYILGAATILLITR